MTDARMHALTHSRHTVTRQTRCGWGVHRNNVKLYENVVVKRARQHNGYSDVHTKGQYKRVRYFCKHTCICVVVYACACVCARTCCWCAADVLIMMCQALTDTSCAPLPPQQASCCVLCNFVVVIVALTNYLTNLVCAHCFIWQHLFHTMRVCFRFVFYSTLEYTV